MFCAILGYCFQHSNDIMNRLAAQTGVQFVESEPLGFGFSDGSVNVPKSA